MKTNLWNSLEILPTQAALLVEWQKALGAEFALARVFLRPTQQQVDSYPCLNLLPCGCRHRVTFESEDHVSAVCDCEEAGCDPIALRPDDLTVYALHGELLAAALRRAFEFEEAEGPASGEIRSVRVGYWGARRSRVFFFVPMSEAALLEEVDRLNCVFVDPCILLTPTSRSCTDLVQRALRRCGTAQISLTGLVSLAAPGQLSLPPSAKASVESILGDFGRRNAEGTPLERAIARVEAKITALAKSRKLDEGEPASDEVARRAFALVKELEPGPRTENPSFLTVFRLYCIDGISATQIAMQCGCSKGTVLNRLNALTKRLGMPLARLRSYSSQFERMEEGLDDWRAKRIDRQELAHGPEDENET